MIYIELFISFLQIGLFSIGGGYAALPLIQNQIVDVHGWLSLKEFVDVISIAEMTPGPIAVNSATFVGIKIAGLGGAFVSTFGCILPSCIIVMLFSYLYHKYKRLTVIQGILNGLRPAVVSLIASAGLTILLLTLFASGNISFESINILNMMIIIIGIVMLRVYKSNPLIIIGSSGAVGLFIYIQEISSTHILLLENGTLLLFLMCIDLIKDTNWKKHRKKK